MMLPKFNYRLLPEAIVDFNEAILWYRGKNKALPKRLRADLRQPSIANISTNPFAHAIRYADVHVAALKIFPLTIHYQIEEDQSLFLIIGIYHEASNPEKWAYRLFI